MITLNQLKNCFSLDIETTGTDERKHGVVSIGACCFDTDEDFYRELVLPENCEYDAEALKVNGENEKELKSRTSPEYTTIMKAVLELFNWCNQNEVRKIVGKNPAFDLRFLRYLWNSCNLGDRQFVDFFSLFGINWVDFVVPLYLHHGNNIPAGGIRNTELYPFLRIPDETKPHNALNGAKHNKMAIRRIFEMYNESS